MKISRQSIVALVVVVVLGAIYGWNRGYSNGPERRGQTPSVYSSASGTHSRFIHGSKADDTLYGTESGESIDASAGRDKIVARGGADILNGGTGADLLEGGAGDDTYVFAHHGDGPDVVQEESGTDILELEGGSVALADMRFLRHGDDLLIRWSHNDPLDSVMIRSWFAGAQYRVERLRLPDGTAVPMESLAARAKQASSEELIHFAH